MARLKTTLHKAITKILSSLSDKTTTYDYLEKEIARLDLYRRKDGKHPKIKQLQARVRQYPELFYHISTKEVTLLATQKAKQRIIDGIDNFFSIFYNRLGFINKYCHESIEGYILAIVNSDALSSYKYKKVNNNKDRFTRFIEKYSNCSEILQLISLPLLRYNLMKSPNIYKELIKMLERDFEVTEFYHNRVDYNNDVNWNKLKIEVKKIYNNKETEEIRNKAQYFKYSSILYTKYRCGLVHEANLPVDEAFSFDDEVLPHYNVEMASVRGENKNMIRFRIPYMFINNLFFGCIDNFENECNKNLKHPLE